MLKNITLLTLAFTVSYTVACESPKQQLTRHQAAQLAAQKTAKQMELKRINQQYESLINKHEGPGAAIEISPKKPALSIKDKKKNLTQSRMDIATYHSDTARKLNF